MSDKSALDSRTYFGLNTLSFHFFFFFSSQPVNARIKVLVDGPAEAVCVLECVAQLRPKLAPGLCVMRKRE